MTQLRYLEDLIDLKIKSISDMPKIKRRNYAKIEQRVMKEYKAPSLSAYILYEYHFNGQIMTNLVPKLEVSLATVFSIMKDLGIPTRKPFESKDKKLAFEKLVREKYRISSTNYLDRKYNEYNLSLRKIKVEIKKEFGMDISHSTLATIMEIEGTERRTLSEAARLICSKRKKSKAKK